jgi:hypothetical protein
VYVLLWGYLQSSLNVFYVHSLIVQPLNQRVDNYLRTPLALVVEVLPLPCTGVYRLYAGRDIHYY